MHQEGKSRNRQLLMLLTITVLANVPFLSPEVVFAHDTLHKFAIFHYVYSHLYFFGEFPRWIPVLAYGIPADYHLFLQQPTDLIVMLLGRLLNLTDALLLFKIGTILSQCIFAFGLLLLSERCYRSRLTVFLVCVGAVLTNSWLTQMAYTLGVGYLIPLVLYFLLRFMEDKAPAHLWTAAILETYSLFGVAPYVAPIHLLILVTFSSVFMLKDRSLILDFCRWRNFVHPLFFVFAGFLLLLGRFLLESVQGLDIIDAHRDPESGNLYLWAFLTYGHKPLAALVLALVKGDVAYGDLTLFIGVLPLATLGYALVRRRDVRFLAVAMVALVLFWLSQGGWFAELLHRWFPLMNKCRTLSHIVNLGRLFLLLMGGFGIDQLLLDLGDEPQNHADDVPACGTSTHAPGRGGVFRRPDGEPAQRRFARFPAQRRPRGGCGRLAGPLLTSGASSFMPYCLPPWPFCRSSHGGRPGPARFSWPFT